MTEIKKLLARGWRSLDESWRFALIAFTTLQIFYGLWSWAILTIYPLAVQNLELLGESVVSTFSLQDSTSHIHLRKVNDSDLTFRPYGADTLKDIQTNSVWNASTGRAIEGKLKGASLSPADITPERIFPYHGARPCSIAWLAIWQRFDANWYVSIAENGYGNMPGAEHFPPMYPMLLAALKPLFGSAFLAGLVISHAATLYTIKLLHQLFQGWGNSTLTRRAAALFLIFPSSFFLFSAYSEPVFLVMALLAFRSMKNRSWGWAGFWAFCAILTRLQGAALLIPMLYLMWKSGEAFPRKPAHWFGLSMPAMGGLFYLFLRSQQVNGDSLPLVEADWRAHLTFPWETYLYSVKTLLSGHFIFIDLLNWAIATLFIILLTVGWRKIPLEYNLYSLFSLIIILIRYVNEQPLISMSRYALTLFPIFFTLGTLTEKPWAQRLVVYTSLALNLYLSAQFFTWGWVA